MTTEARHTPLTRREVEVVDLVVEGLTNQAIADVLGISKRTVHAHVSAAMSKTQTHTRTQLAVWALRTKADVVRRPLGSEEIGTSAN